MELLKGVFLDGRKTEVLTIKKSLDEYYKLLNCHTIDIISREINGVSYDIICDDEGLFKDEIVITCVNTNFEPMLVGSLFIVAFDGKDDIRSLTEKEIENLYLRIIKNGILVID